MATALCRQEQLPRKHILRWRLGDAFLALPQDRPHLVAILHLHNDRGRFGSCLRRLIVIYITPEGNKARLASAEDCAKALRLGLLFSRSMVYHDAIGSWVRAVDHPALAVYFPQVEDFGPPWYYRWLALLAVLLWLGGLVVPPGLALLHSEDVAPVAVASASGALLCLLTGLILVGGMSRLLGLRARNSWLLLGFLGGLALCYLDAFMLPKVLPILQQLEASARDYLQSLGTVEAGPGAATSAASASSEAGASQ